MNEGGATSNIPCDGRWAGCSPISDADETKVENRGPAIASLLMVLLAIGLIFLPTACGLPVVIGAPHALSGSF